MTIKNFGDRIKYLRKAKFLKAKEFAESIKISPSYLSEIENNKKMPSESLLLLIGNIYNANKDWLQTGEGEMLSDTQPAPAIPDIRPKPAERHDYPDMSSTDTEVMQLVLAVLNTRDEILIEMARANLIGLVSLSKKKAGPPAITEDAQLEPEKKRAA
jgi:transcriptional regulator with XRE-family HTH domain